MASPFARAARSDPSAVRRAAAMFNDDVDRESGRSLSSSDSHVAKSYPNAAALASSSVNAG